MCDSAIRPFVQMNMPYSCIKLFVYFQHPHRIWVFNQHSFSYRLLIHPYSFYIFQQMAWIPKSIYFFCFSDKKIKDPDLIDAFYQLTNWESEKEKEKENKWNIQSSKTRNTTCYSSNSNNTIKHPMNINIRTRWRFALIFYVHSIEMNLIFFFIHLYKCTQMEIDLRWNFTFCFWNDFLFISRDFKRIQDSSNIYKWCVRWVLSFHSSFAAHV